MNEFFSREYFLSCESNNLRVDVSCDGKFFFKMVADPAGKSFKIEFYDLERDNEALKGEVDLQRLLLVMTAAAKELSPEIFDEKIQPLLSPSSDGDLNFSNASS